MESLKNAIKNIIPEFAGIIVEHVGYPFQVDNKIRDLENVTRDLVALKEDVKTVIENAERENGAPTKQVEEWLRNVEFVEKEAKEIKKNSRKRHRSIWSDYMTSKSAAKKFCEVKSLFDQKATIEITMCPPPSLAQEMPASSSQSSKLESALHYIKNDEHGIIGIWGMGGVGKTHLLKQINNELCKDDAFSVVVFITCSKECYEEKVQDEIIVNLRLSKLDNTEQKKITIYNFLNKRSFVLLLDDLWNRVDLKKIGIPNLVDTIGTCKRKIVLTTRSTEVCGQMEVRKRIRLDVLNWDDAWSLFKEKVTEEIINSDLIIQRCSVDVAKELGGLSLALIVVGRAMHDKTESHEWEQAFELLKQARLYDIEFSSTNRTIFHTLKFSFDSLRNEALKQCFLHCALWPEDYRIGNTDLIELWMGLGLINEPNIHVAYIVGYSYIRRLQAVCLLETTNDDHYVVKMHDVIRDMALWITNNQENKKKKWYVQTGILQQSYQIEISRDTKTLSIMYGRIEKLFLSNTCSLNKLSTLLLRHNGLCDSKSLQLEAFFELVVLDLSWNNFESFHIEICKLIRLQFLNLSGNFQLKSLPGELKNLINLRYLLLKETEQCAIPNGVLSKLKALKVLELRYNYRVRVTEAMLEIFASLEEELQCLSQFKALEISITNMHDFHMLSETSVPIRALDIKILEANAKCLSFSSLFLGNPRLQNNLLSLELSGIHVDWVKFERKSHEHSICHLERLEDLTFYGMTNMKQVVWINLDPKDVFFRLQVVTFMYCDKLKSISWIARLPCIRVLHVIMCRSIKQIINIFELNKGGLMACQPSFPFLKEMNLIENDELKSISDSMITFPVL